MSSGLLELRITAWLILPMMGAATLLSIVTVALLFTRAKLYGYRVYRPMLLNLALAWIPILCVGVALLFFLAQTEHARWITLGLVIVWFFFFPNSTYLITEFHHLKEDVTEVPFWFDAVAILSLALSGVILGSFSLLLIHRLIGLYLSWPDAWLALAGCLYVCWLQWRRRLTLGQAMIALLCTLILTGKVFSPQYLLWLIPLIASVGAARWWLWWWVGVSLLTMGAYTLYYGQLTDAATAAHVLPTLPGFFAVVAARNAAFLFIALAYIFNWRHARQDSGPSASPQRSA